MEKPTASFTAEIYLQPDKQTEKSTALHPLKVWEQFGDGGYPILKLTQLENYFHQNNFIKTRSLLW